MRDFGDTTVVTADGQTILLGKLIKAGGAGGVYRLAGSTAQVAKIYHANVDLADNERRIAAMLELRPQLPELQAGDEHVVQLAWPQALIYDEQKRFLGYLMPAVDIEATSELECVLQERQARKLGLPTGLGAKVTLAANLCAVIAELHRQRHYVVDLKPVNLRFYRQSLYMAMLDCDGFSIQGHGERFEAPQYTPDYLAPEFHARGLFGTGEVQQDRFALAVVVFQLLNFGIHPFTGRPQDESVPNDIPSRIAGRWYAHGTRPNTLLLPTPASGHAAMPDELRQLFDRAFESAGGTRPTADEWSDALRGYAQRAAGKLTVCERDAMHQHFSGLPCAACARVQLMAGTQAAAAKAARAAKLFPQQAYAPPPAPTTGKAQRPPRTGPMPAPPNIVTTARNRTVAAPTPGAVGQPANWPAPPPPIPQNTAVFWGKRVDLGTVCVILGGLVMGLMLLVSVLLRNFTDWLDEPTQQEVVEAHARPRQDNEALKRVTFEPIAETVAATVGPAKPTDLELLQLESELNQLAGEVVADNPYAFEKGLVAMRDRARGRREAWQIHAARNPGPDGQVSADPLVDFGATARVEGFQALVTKHPELAGRRFVQALWADSYDAEAWRGFALSRQDAPKRIGGLAIAMLHYANAEAVAGRKAQTIDTLVDTIGGGNLQQKPLAERAFDSARRYADRLLPRLTPGTVPFDGRFGTSWDNGATRVGEAAPVGGRPAPDYSFEEDPDSPAANPWAVLNANRDARAARIRAEEAAKKKQQQ